MLTLISVQIFDSLSYDKAASGTYYTIQSLSCG